MFSTDARRSSGILHPHDGENLPCSFRGPCSGQFTQRTATGSTDRIPKDVVIKEEAAIAGIR